MRRRLLVLILALVAVVLALTWLLTRDNSRVVPTNGGAVQSSGAEPRSEVPNKVAPAPSGDPLRKERATRESRAQRDALHAQIVKALAAQNTTTTTQPPPSAPRADAPRPPGNLTDRTGGRQALAARLNKDFMPLADECIELAQKDAPDLAGMLVIGLDAVADKELGAVVEDVQLPPANQIKNPALIECIRETALSLTLPPSPGSGREKFELSIPIKPRAREAGSG